MNTFRKRPPLDAWGAFWWTLCLLGVPYFILVFAICAMDPMFRLFDPRHWASALVFASPLGGVILVVAILAAGGAHLRLRARKRRRGAPREF